MPDKHRLQLDISNELKETLDGIAEKYGLTRAYLARTGIKLMITHIKKIEEGYTGPTYTKKDDQSQKV